MSSLSPEAQFITAQSGRVYRELRDPAVPEIQRASPGTKPALPRRLQHPRVRAASQRPEGDRGACRSPRACSPAPAAQRLHYNLSRTCVCWALPPRSRPASRVPGEAAKARGFPQPPGPRCGVAFLVATMVAGNTCPGSWSGQWGQGCLLGHRRGRSCAGHPVSSF